MKTIRLLLAFVIYFNFVGCATTKIKGPTMKEVCDSYIGSHYSELLERWGPYDYDSEDGKGGRILTWSKTSVNTTYYPGKKHQYYTSPGEAYTSEQEYYTRFWVTSDGIVYHWQSNQKTKAEIDADLAAGDAAITIALVIILVAGLIALIVTYPGDDTSNY